MPIGIWDIEIRQLSDIEARFVKHQSFWILQRNPSGLKVHLYNYFEDHAIYRLKNHVLIYCLGLVAL